MIAYKGFWLFFTQSGGKAGKGRNVTASIQVREKMGIRYLVKKSFRYTVNDTASKQRAVDKAKEFINQLINQ